MNLRARGLTTMSVAVLVLFVWAGQGSFSQATTQPDLDSGPALFTCGAVPFALSVFDGPAGAQTAPTGLGRALKHYIRHDPWGMNVPARGWRLLGRKTNVAEFMSGKPNRRYNDSVEFRRERGRWVSWTAGNCDPMRFRPNATPAEWFLRKDRNPKPTDRSVAIDATEWNCAGGRLPTGRVLEPEIDYFQRSIRITIFIRNQSGPQTCPSNPPFRMKVQLKEEIGDRHLVDGGIYPYSRR